MDFSIALAKNMSRRLKCLLRWSRNLGCPIITYFAALSNALRFSLITMFTDLSCVRHPQKSSEQAYHFHDWNSECFLWKQMKDANVNPFPLHFTDVPEYVVKAQILAGGRGKGHFDNGFKGGVHITKKWVLSFDSSILSFYNKTRWLGRRCFAK